MVESLVLTKDKVLVGLTAVSLVLKKVEMMADLMVYWMVAMMVGWRVAQSAGLMVAEMAGH